MIDLQAAIEKRISQLKKHRVKQESAAGIAKEQQQIRQSLQSAGIINKRDQFITRM